jgi:MYXO-CTERM domain-containing protein
MKTKRTLGYAFFASFVAVSASYLPQSAHAVAGLSLTDSIGAPNAISISPGQSFSITMTLTATTEQLIGAGYSLVAPGAGAGKFTLVSRDVVGTPFSDLIVANVSNTTVSDVATVNLGGLVESTPVQPGSYFLANYVISSSATLSPGIYTLQADPNAVAPDPSFNSVPLSTSTYQVTVVPEPGTAALALGGLGLLGALRRPRKKP